MSLYNSRSNQKSDIDALWLEFKVAAQFAKTWDRAEENVALIRRKEMRDSLPTQDDLTGLAPITSRGGSPAFWMSQVDVPAWFRRDELGLGSTPNVFDTASGLEKSNADRRRRYDEMLARLEQAREAKLIKRTVRG